MSLSIFDVDEMDTEVIDENEIKIFSKYCGLEANSRLEVETGCFSKNLRGEDAVIVFRLSDVFLGANWTINADKDNHGVELIFRDRESCEAFRQALEFAANVLKEARTRALSQKEERPF